MSETSVISEFRKELLEAITNKTFLKLSMGNYKGEEKDLKNVYVRPVQIKRQDKLSFTFRYRTRDIVKNFSPEEGVELVTTHLNSGFRIATLFTPDVDFVLQQNQDGIYRMNKNAGSLKQGNGLSHDSALSHDKVKERILQPIGKKYLHELQITDREGRVYKNSQDKFKQINQYIEILSPMIKSIPASKINHVVDMGSGKGYLTFALYDYLQSVLKINAQVTGVEYREDLVALCNKIAGESSFQGLNFVQGTIEDYPVKSIDLLIALHACDTATDDAIAKGITADAKLIVVAPCCHKQIRKEITKGKVGNDLDFLTQHGIFLERQAEMVTDGMRALVMEYFGYKTKAMQFISDAHTPKNVLLVGVKQGVNPINQAKTLKKIRDTKAYFGIGYHHLERLMGLEAEYVNLS
jgi:SAM-dependent methyltransferase